MISVLVVDDSSLIRKIITDALGEDPQIQVVGTASNGKIALTKIDQLAPDLITLDIEMPEMDGLTTLRNVRKTRPKLPVIMFSTLTAAGANATLEALSAGASDYVTKPSNTGSFNESRRMVQEQLIPRIKALTTRAYVGPARPRPKPANGAATTAGGAAGGSAGATAVEEKPSGKVDIVAVGCSTGGPDALAKVVADLPGHFPTPIVVVQHMPPVFTKMFAQRLDRDCPLRVVEATDNMALEANTIYIAPGDHHMEVVRRGTGVFTKLHDGPPENFCRPAVDPLFRSVARAYGRSTLAVILTGMGQDGKRGAETLREAGAEIVAQDEPTSVVWGMPGAVVQAGIAHTVLPLNEVATHIKNRTAVTGRAERTKAVTPWR